MKLKLKIDSTVLVLEGEDAHHAIALAERAEVWESSWDGKLTKKEKQNIEFQFVKEEDLLPVPEPIQSLSKSVEEANSRWYREYTEHDKTKKEKKALEERLEALQKAVQGEV